MGLLMTRMLFAIIATASLLLPRTVLASADSQPPNIVYLMTDDQRWDNLGCYGRPEFKTPNIDHLAEQGVLFERAYYAVSICMPSRVTTMTGRHISSHRCGFVHPNNYTMSRVAMQDSYPAVLKRAGYRTGFVGKYGFAITPERLRPNMPMKNYNVKANFGPLFDFFAGTGTHVGGGLQQWPEEDETLAAIYAEGRPKNERTPRTGDAMVRFLETQPKGQPFCLSVSFLAVKHDNDARDIYPPHHAPYKGQEMLVPENYVEGSNDTLPKVVRDHARGYRLHLKRTGVPEQYQVIARGFAAQAYSVDQQVGRLVKKLEELDLLDNTVIVFTSDNGRFQGSHGLYDKALLYEESVRAPLVVFDGRMPQGKRGRRLQAIYSSVDHASTILGFAGLEAPASMEGYDFSPLIRGDADAQPPRDAVLLEDCFLSSMFAARGRKDVDTVNERVISENQSYRSRGIVTDEWKYFVYYEHQPRIEELYHLSNDPLEQDNLASKPEYKGTLQQLRKQCQAMYEEIVGEP